MDIALDVIALGVILGCGAYAWYKGFIQAALGFLPMLRSFPRKARARRCSASWQILLLPRTALKWRK